MLKITNYKNKIIFLSVIWILLLIAVSIWSVFTGQYPLTIKGLLDGDKMMLMVFFRLRLPRVIMGIIGGFGLSIAGYVYQLVFKNPLASPDIAGVSSGASAGAAFAIVAVSASAPFISICAFAGGLIALSITLLTAYAVPGKNRYTIILTGIAIHSVAQTILMFLKLAADPEKQLASIEYWIMGSLNGISLYTIKGNVILCILCISALFLLYRQIMMLSLHDDEGRMLGVHTQHLRLLILLIATLATSGIISMTGLISFISLLAPHGARLIIKNNRLSTMFLSGIIGGCLLTLGDILARSVASTELPVSIFTSLVGAPFLVYLCVRRNRES